MAKSKRKRKLNAALKALLAGAQTSPLIKIPATFIAELASLPDDQQTVLAELSQDQFNELLLQSELAAVNAAQAAVDTKQIKALVKELIEKVDALVRPETGIHERVVHNLSYLSDGGQLTNLINTLADMIPSDLDSVIASFPEASQYVTPNAATRIKANELVNWANKQKPSRIPDITNSVNSVQKSDHDKSIYHHLTKKNKYSFTSTQATKSKVTVLLEGDHTKFKKAKREAFILALAGILQVDPCQIHILEVASGSILLTLEMPKESAELLLSMYLGGHSKIDELKIKNIHIQITEEIHSAQKDITMSKKSAKRFKIALSFPGERRDFVEKIAKILCRKFAKNEIFYDKHFEAELARPDLDTYLQDIYHHQSELIVVFLCEEYEKKEWCGLEWRAIRDLIKQRKTSDIMPIRFDLTHIAGLFSIDGYIEIDKRSPEEIAELIFKRYTINQQGPC